MSPTPQASFKSHIAKRIVSSPGVIAPLRAGHYGLDRLRGKPPVLELYYQAGDPHSHLAAQWLRQNTARIDLPIQVRLVGNAEAALYPEAEKQRQFALNDAAMIAPAYGLAFSADYAIPSAANTMIACRHLMRAQNLESFLKSEAQWIADLFAGIDLDPSTSADEQETQNTLEANVRRRARLGHYLPGVWQLQGRWYWGIDRLTHLQEHLRRLGALRGERDLIECQPALAALPKQTHDGRLDFFYSFRSPYSYLAAVKLQQMYESLPVELNIRPVLPMAMRGLKVPSRKRLYIARDVYREAQHLGIEFGQIADPLGDGALRCLTVFTLAQGTSQQMDFLLAASRAVWSQGIDVASDPGMKYVCQQAGLDWNIAKRKLDAGFDLETAELNRQDLFAHGLWGVPSFHCGPLITWGRDRWWLVEEYLKRETN